MSFTTPGVPITTDTLVRQVCSQLSTGDGVDTSPFIQVAHTIVNENLDGKVGFNRSELSLQTLTNIETYLAAHFAAVTYPVPSFEGAGKVQESAQFKVDIGFRFTKYGQMAIALDTTGILNKMADGKLISASIDWLGTCPEGDL